MNVDPPLCKTPFIQIWKTRYNIIFVYEVAKNYTYIETTCFDIRRRYDGKVLFLDYFGLTLRTMRSMHSTIEIS